MSSNGRLTAAELTPIVGGVGNTAAGEGCLENHAASCWNGFAAECRAHGQPNPVVNGPSCAYRSYAMQVYFYDLYLHHGGNLAAYPGTSNHGWGKATDTPSYVWALMRAYGAKYGWGPCSDAPSEAWHRSWCGGDCGPAPGPAPHDRYPTLRRGSKLHGPIRRAQKHLRRWNVGITQPSVDGIFGKTTRKSVVQFQIVHQLHPDGVIGDNTWAVLRRTDYFLDDERWHLNNLRLAHYRRAHGTVSHDTRQKMEHWRQWCGQRAARLWEVGQKEGFDKAHRSTRFKAMKAASGQ